jgi:hypothetical protein
MISGFPSVSRQFLPLRGPRHPTVPVANVGDDASLNCHNQASAKGAPRIGPGDTPQCDPGNTRLLSGTPGTKRQEQAQRALVRGLEGLIEGVSIGTICFHTHRIHGAEGF